MNDRYLFRAKRIDTGEWYIGNLVDCPDGRNVIAEVGGNWALHEVDPSTICQYTGLTDKNGNKIWENDVVEAWSDGTMACGKVQQRIDGTWIMYPAWQNKTMWYFIPNEFGETTVEVIGNIFDNPELLENE